MAHGAEDADLRELKWRKYPDDSTYAPLLKENSFVEGMGHNSVIEENGNFYIVYHGRDKGKMTAGVDTRSARIDRLYIDGDRLEVRVTK